MNHKKPKEIRISGVTDEDNPISYDTMKRSSLRDKKDKVTKRISNVRKKSIKNEN
jgi:hypothetical protein